MTNEEILEAIEKLAKEVNTQLGKDFGKLSQYDIGFEEGYIASLMYVKQLLQEVTQGSFGLYVAVDGNWGDASGIVIIDDTNWEQSDYRMIDEATDSNKVDVAEAIDLWIKAGRHDFGVPEDELADTILTHFHPSGA